MRLSRLDGWPARSPADASPLASRPDTHGSGPTWIATPSSYRTLTDYSWPVSRRTTKPHSKRPTKCVVPESRGALSRDEEDALWQAFYTAAPAQRREFEPSSKRRKRRPASSPPATG